MPFYDKNTPFRKVPTLAIEPRVRDISSSLTSQSRKLGSIAMLTFFPESCIKLILYSIDVNVSDHMHAQLSSTQLKFNI
jgi:hypothetical protein